MADQLSEDRQQLIFRYMQEAVRSEPPEARRRPTLDVFGQVDAPPPSRLDLLRWRVGALMHRHPQLGLALVLVAIAVTVGWLVARM